MTIIDVHATLFHHGLIGPKATQFGSPEELILSSPPPASKNSQWSFFASPPTFRCIIRQPALEADDDAKNLDSSALEGDLDFLSTTKILFATIEEWVHGAWYHKERVEFTSFEMLFTRLQPYTSTSVFEGKLEPHYPQRPFWSGALSYDMAQMTQSIAFRNRPDPGQLLGILYYVNGGIFHNTQTQMVTVVGGHQTWRNLCNEAVNRQKIMATMPDVKSQNEVVTASRSQHISRIEAVQRSIRRGHVYQANIGMTWQGAIEDPTALFYRLTLSNPAPFSGFLLSHDLSFGLISCSPELLLKSTNGLLTSSPIKGTCAQDEDQRVAQHHRDAMVGSKKERAEHRMLVDLIQNDLTTVCEPKSVFVEQFLVESYAHVQHLVSHIQGEHKNSNHTLSALDALFPGGSITGCPRTMSCGIINEIEEQPRSFWTGSLGWIDVHSGECNWNILIRTMELQHSTEGWVGTVTAGGGITIESIPEHEVDEAILKGQDLRAAAGWIDLPQMKKRGLATQFFPLPPESTPLRVKGAGTILELDEALDKVEGSVLLVENLDSFSYNIARTIAQLGHNVTVFKCRSPQSKDYQDGQWLSLIESLKPSHIVIGPGPGRPKHSIIAHEIVKAILDEEVRLPLLGICLGHQSMGEHLGLTLIEDPYGPSHGIPIQIQTYDEGLVTCFPKDAQLARYNSLTLVGELPDDWFISSHQVSTNQIMSIEHKHRPLFGVQFHPESIGSTYGHLLIQKFLELSSHA